MKKISVSFIFAAVCFCCLFGQIGINTTSPNIYTALDVENLLSGGEVFPKGISVPSMTTAGRDSIGWDGKTNPKIYNYDDMPDGLLVFNLDEHAYNYFSSAGKTWKSLAGTAAHDKGECAVTENDIVVKGRYIKTLELDASNSLQLPLFITKKGFYRIAAIAYQNNGDNQPDRTKYNGYYFLGSGEFPYDGAEIVMNIPAVGAPLHHSADLSLPDVIVVSVNGVEVATVYNHIVDPASSPVRFNCSKTAVSGYFFAHQDVSQGLIHCNISADSSVSGMGIKIFSDVIDGLSFVGLATLRAGENNVFLKPVGIPERAGNYEFTLYTDQLNPDGTPVYCTAAVKVAARSISILSLGSGSMAMSNDKVKNVFANPNLFGKYQHSVCPVDTIHISTSNPANAAVLQNLINTNKPDIIILHPSFVALTAQAAGCFRQYVDKGGVLLHTYDANYIFTLAVIDSITGASMSYKATSNYYKYRIHPAGTISNGPFGDLAGMHIQQDGSVYYFSAPEINADVLDVVLTFDGNSDVFGFKHKTKPYLFIGEGGFFGNGNTNNSNYPFSSYLDVSAGLYYPSAYYNSARSSVQVTSFFWLNTISWAIEQVMKRRPLGTEGFNIH